MYNIYIYIYTYVYTYIQVLYLVYGSKHLLREYAGHPPVITAHSHFLSSYGWIYTYMYVYLYIYIHILSK